MDLIVGLKVVQEDEDLMIISALGTVIRTSMAGISVMGRNTQGVRLINIREDDEVGTLARVQKNEEQNESEEDGDWEETTETTESEE